VRDALIQAGRQALIGHGCDCLIPAQPPKEAIAARRQQANRVAQGDEDSDHSHTVANPARGEKAGERGLGCSRRRDTGQAARGRVAGIVIRIGRTGTRVRGASRLM
jgi:hypothetical protein